jgi:hypothetical protein
LLQWALNAANRARWSAALRSARIHAAALCKRQRLGESMEGSGCRDPCSARRCLGRLPRRPRVPQSSSSSTATSSSPLLTQTAPPPPTARWADSGSGFGLWRWSSTEVGSKRPPTTENLPPCLGAWPRRIGKAVNVALQGQAREAPGTGASRAPAPCDRDGEARGDAMVGWSRGGGRRVGRFGGGSVTLEIWRPGGGSE